MVEAIKRRRWAVRLTILAAILCFGAVVAALVASVGSGQGAWHFRTGFTVLRYAFFVAIGGALIALIGAWLAWRTRPRLAVINILALLTAVGFVAYLGNLARTAYSAPPIHDVTTNLDDPPRFYRLGLRRDNLANVPAGGRRDLEAMEPRERWKAIHREHYGDIATIRVPWSRAETIDRAARLAERRGWEIVTVDRANGILEAVDTSRFFRFRDNVILRAIPVSESGAGSMVDMRSVSRVGVSDVGMNAKRVRAFLADLQRAELPQR
jgi:uncharacterized protein (DUF1499 family)